MHPVKPYTLRTNKKSFSINYSFILDCLLEETKSYNGEDKSASEHDV